jgi:hypothetical protein
MAIINQSKTSSSLANSSKVSIGETWASILTSWASETRTWLEVSQLLTNTDKQSTEFIATEALDYLVTEDNNYLVTGVNLITNQSKP